MPVMVALNSADTALDIEALSDQQAVEEAMQVSSRRLTGTVSPVLIKARA